MSELVEIIKGYEAATLAAQACVLATVVHLEGSSYRRPGARMLVLEDGRMIGAISGGCLEGDALKKALLTFTEKKTRLVTYDTGDEEDASVGIQLGCEGIIQVLFEYIDANAKQNPISLLKKAVEKRQDVVLVTLFNLMDKQAIQLGTCLLQTSNNDTLDISAGLPFMQMLQEDATRVFAARKSIFKNYAEQGFIQNAFIEYIQPPISLVVVGAGNDAIPLMQMAAILGWEVKVVDGRNTHAKTDRFINACQVLVSKPEAVLSQIAIDKRTCFVLMTHNYPYDMKMLKALLDTNVTYIGLLGPKKKLHKMLEEYKQEGLHITDEQLARIYGPIGLEIGAETAEEIAASIIAEIQAVFTGKSGGMLKWKKEFIHS
jgi:xanthine/CO dehydrogenase XdhC/CoxF family maturation factor